MPVPSENKCYVRLPLTLLFLYWQPEASYRETSDRFVDSIAQAIESTSKRGLLCERLRRLHNKGEYQIKPYRALASYFRITVLCARYTTRNAIPNLRASAKDRGMHHQRR